MLEAGGQEGIWVLRHMLLGGGCRCQCGHIAGNSQPGGSAHWPQHPPFRFTRVHFPTTPTLYGLTCIISIPGWLVEGAVTSPGGTEAGR